jgi:hypothetical protein
MEVYSNFGRASGSVGSGRRCPDQVSLQFLDVRKGRRIKEEDSEHGPPVDTKSEHAS